MVIAELLKYWRAERDFSFRQLSELSDVDGGSLNKLENNVSIRPGRNILIRVSIGLGLDIDDTDELLMVAGHVPLRKMKMD
jgi:transcriptional regulator with XRE-family HTH domain